MMENGKSERWRVGGDEGRDRKDEEPKYEV